MFENAASPQIHIIKLSHVRQVGIDGSTEATCCNPADKVQATDTSSKNCWAQVYICIWASTSIGSDEPALYW